MRGPHAPGARPPSDSRVGRRCSELLRAAGNQTPQLRKVGGVGPAMKNAGSWRFKMYFSLCLWMGRCKSRVIDEARERELPSDAEIMPPGAKRMLWSLSSLYPHPLLGHNWIKNHSVEIWTNHSGLLREGKVFCKYKV